MLSMTLCIYLEWMWEAFHAGLGHEPMLHGIISHSGATWIFSHIKISRPKSVKVKV